MKRSIMAAAVWALCVAIVQGAETDASFNFGWRFALGDHSDAIASEFDDSSWKTVDLPHDWAISGPFDPQLSSGTGMLPWQGEGWYRKSFQLSAEDSGKRVQLIFDGVMASPVVYLNGQQVGAWRYGYNSFWLDATDAAKFGQRNVLTVHADTRQHSSRWYPGAGIYRKVTLRIVEPVHIPVWGVFVTTPQVTEDQATVQLQVQLTNMTGQAQQVETDVTLLDPSGSEIGKQAATVVLQAMGTGTTELSLRISQPQRWDVDSPQRYTAVTRLVVDHRECHRVETPFGVRTFQWTANDGFHLNGRRVQLYGVDLHHAHGPLGAAFFPRAMERQLQIMKAMGANALRTSHNAPAPEVLDLCDRLGIVVFNELFDKYGPTAGVQCSTAEYVNQYAEAEVRNFVLRDRNHPSVFIWSVGNEISDILGNRDGQAAQHMADMVRYFKRYDTTRPTTMGAHVPSSAQPGKHIWDALDSSGWNYSAKYMTARATYPDKPLIYSESASAFSTRGAYKLEHAKSKTDWGDDGLLTAYEQTSASWSDIPEHEFERMRKDTFVAGEFVWTGFDYLGEPTPIRGDNRTADGREARSSYFGIVDLVGLPKDRFYLYRSHWRPEQPTVHVAPHWNWSGRDGELIPVTVYTNGDEAELFLNGKSYGCRRKVDPDSLAADNLAFGKQASASSEELKQDADGNVLQENLATKAVDGVSSTRWCAADGSFPQVWQVDLETPQRFGAIQIDWEKSASNYQFDVEASKDGDQWTPLKETRNHAGRRSILAFAPVVARYVRVRITGGSRQAWASICEFAVQEQVGGNGNPYYDIVDAYRLRWLDVPYEPGELKAVAYRQGSRIGETTVRTAGPPARLRLTPDRSTLRADGMDLCYVTVEMVDAGGDVCPLAMDMVEFSVEGPVRLAGVGNGDQLGMDGFTDSTHPLFYGKAVAILRSCRGAEGRVVLKAQAKGVMPAATTIHYSGEGTP